MTCIDLAILDCATHVPFATWDHDSLVQTHLNIAMRAEAPLSNALACHVLPCALESSS